MAAGNFETTMLLLSRQLGIVNFAPLKSSLIDLRLGSHSYLRALSLATVIPLAIENEINGLNERSGPDLVIKFSLVGEKLKPAYWSLTDGKFGDALKHFLSIEA